MTPEQDRIIRCARMFAAVVERFGIKAARELQRRHGIEGDAIERAYCAALGIAADQPTRAHRDVDHVMVLRCEPGLHRRRRDGVLRRYRAAKLITPAGIEDYDAGAWFASASIEVRGLVGLVDLLNRLEREPAMHALRAQLIEGRDPNRVRRLLYLDPKTGAPAYFEPIARRWAALDFDGIERVNPVDLDEVAAAAIARLPEPFGGASCWAHLTGSAGFKPTGRCRLWFWLSRETTGAELKHWLRGVPGLDLSTCNDVTPIYTARPIFDGVPDPVPVRSKLIAGEVDRVAVPDIPAEPERPTHPAADPRPYTRPERGLGYRATPAERYMLACLRALAGAPQGQGRERCMGVALALYGLAKAGALDPADVTGRLKGAMRCRGWTAAPERGDTLADVDRQLSWAWDHAEPRRLPL